MKNLTDTNKQRFLFDAIRERRHDSIEKLVRDDKSLLLAYDRHSFGATPLTLAVFAGDQETAAVLIDLGADLDRPSQWEPGPWTPMHCAVHTGNQELASFLLSRGARLDAHAAAGMNLSDELLQIIRKNPAAVHERGGDGCLPLHFAGGTETVDVLLQHGADIDARDVDHYSTAAQYRAQPCPVVTRYLFQRGATPDIFSAVLAGDEATVKQLVDADPKSVHEKINQERFPPSQEFDAHNIMTFVVGLNATTLQAAAKADNAAMIKCLAEAGCDLNGRGGYDDATALHIAAWENNFEAARQLIALGADINLLSGDIHNNSAAGWCIVAGSADVFDLLIEHGAERLEHFLPGAQSAVDGEFKQFKCVPQENYDRILARLTEAS